MTSSGIRRSKPLLIQQKPLATNPHCNLESFFLANMTNSWNDTKSLLNAYRLTERQNSNY